VRRPAKEGCLNGQHVRHELHIHKHALRVGKCHYERTAHAPLMNFFLLAAFSIFFSSRCFSRCFSPGTRPRWNLSTCTETEPTGHRWIRGSGNRSPLLSCHHLLGLSDFTPFFLSLSLSSFLLSSYPHCLPAQPLVPSSPK